MSRETVQKINGVQMKQHLKRVNHFHGILNSKLDESLAKETEALSDPPATNCNCLRGLDHHPTILKMDKKLSRIIYLLESKMKYESASLNYFKVSNAEQLAILEDVLVKDEKEKALIKKHLIRWRGQEWSKKSLNSVLQRIFTDEFLRDYNLSGNKDQNSIMSLNITRTLEDVYLDEGTLTQSEFEKMLRHCLHLAHNRCYKNRKRGACPAIDLSFESNSQSYMEASPAKQIKSTNSSSQPETIHIDSSYPIFDDENSVSSAPENIVIRPVKNEIKEVVSVSKIMTKPIISGIVRFPVANESQLTTLEKALTTQVMHEMIKKQITQWADGDISNKTMSQVFDKLFTSEFIMAYNYKGTKSKLPMKDFNIIRLLGDVWYENGVASDNEFEALLQYCIRLCHNRVHKQNMISKVPSVTAEKTITVVDEQPRIAVKQPAKIVSTPPNNSVLVKPKSAIGKYFKIKDKKTFGHLENVLNTSPNEMQEIKDFILKWKGEKSSLVTMNIVLRNMFTDEFLVQYNKDEGKLEGEFIKSKLVSVIRNVWKTSGTSEEQLINMLRYCIRLAHHRYESDPSVVACVNDDSINANEDSAHANDTESTTEIKYEEEPEYLIEEDDESEDKNIIEEDQTEEEMEGVEEEDYDYESIIDYESEA